MPRLGEAGILVLDEELKQNGSWAARLELIRRVGRLYLKPGTIHHAVLETLEALYEGREEDLAVQDTDKTTQCATALAARVIDVNEASSRNPLHHRCGGVSAASVAQR